MVWLTHPGVKRLQKMVSDVGVFGRMWYPGEDLTGTVAL
jgi:hypothetical protein